MSGFLRKLFGQQPASQSLKEESELEQFYTDSEYARRVFEQMVISANLPKRILVIHGLGGVGKSTLLKIYALTCQKYHIPSALVASEEAPSPVDVLADWESDLNHDGVTLPTFHRTLTHYRAIQAKVEEEMKKGQQEKSQIAGTLGKTAAKTAINMAASAIPIVGPLVGSVGGESASVFIDWLRSFLSKPDMELYLDPVKRLDSDFLSDLALIALHQRIVLMTDTYEQMTALDDWMRELARRLPKNVLFIIAGRTVPSWDRAWQEWMGKAELLELKEMTPDDIRTLVRRYYSYIHSGNPDPRQVEAIVQFARGLPMVATTVVQLWVKYGLEDFQTVRPQVVADLVDRLLEGVPQEIRPAFEAAAVLRYFNVEALKALLESGNAELLYFELRRWPFIRPRREGLAVHDTMREMINEALYVRTPERFRMLHERAATYYEAQLVKAIGDERERNVLERLYHRLQVDESSGVQLFQIIAEELTRYRMVNRLRGLLNDMSNYPLELENGRMWREYYNARLEHLEGQADHAEEGQVDHAKEVYRAIGNNERVDAKLRAYALCDLGFVLSRRDSLRKPGIEEEAIQVLESSLNMRYTIDAKLAMSWIYLCDIYMAKVKYEKSFFYLDKAKRFFTERSDYLGLLTVLEYEQAIYWRLGNLRKTFDIGKEMWNIYTTAGETSYLRNRIFPTRGWIWAGRYAEQEKECLVTLEAASAAQDLEYISQRTRDLALCLGLEGKCSEALNMAQDGLNLASRLKTIDVIAASNHYGIVCYKCGQLDEAIKYFTQAIQLCQEKKAHLDRAPVYLGAVYEVLGKFDQAKDYYDLSLKEALQLERNFNVCADLTGLVRIKYAQNDYVAIPSLWTKAEQLAQQYEYNDYFTSLYLTRGHIVWDGLIPEWESGFDTALHFYQLALIYALRFNRFLLDEVLSGREQGTPLKSIIPHCLGHGKEGQRMLIALRDWWQIDMNDIGIPRLDTISPIPEGISLLGAERIAREREPGDGSSQITMVDQINAALTNAKRLSP